MGRHTDGILQCIAAQPAPCALAIQLDSARVVSRCRAAFESLRSTRIPSQTARLVPSQNIQFDAIAITIKLFVWAASISIKTFGTTKFEEVKTRVQENAEDTTSHPWIGRTPFAVQFFRLSYSD